LRREMRDSVRNRIPLWKVCNIIDNQRQSNTLLGTAQYSMILEISPRQNSSNHENIYPSPLERNYTYTVRK
jgi:hypothetical protein